VWLGKHKPSIFFKYQGVPSGLVSHLLRASGRKLMLRISGSTPKEWLNDLDSNKEHLLLHIKGIPHEY
jgi:hypothetical protein